MESGEVEAEVGTFLMLWAHVYQYVIFSLTEFINFKTTAFLEQVSTQIMPWKNAGNSIKIVLEHGEREHIFIVQCAIDGIYV